MMLHFQTEGKAMSQIAIDILNNKKNMRESVFFDKIQETTEGKILYQCKNHDYVYVPAHFEDADGVRRRGGYYDETGKYYQQLRIIAEDEDAVITCKYCGHTVDLRVNSEVLHDLKCPNCDAVLEYVVEKKIGTAPKYVNVSEIKRPEVKVEATHKDKFKTKSDYLAYYKDIAKRRGNILLHLLKMLATFRLGVLSLLFYNVVAIIILFIAQWLGFID